jgi:transcriptional regulator with XRE-family HTH domain
MTVEVQESARSLVLGKRIVEARKRLNLTQVDLAFKFGVTQSAVAGWERDEYLPALETIVPLAAQLEVTLEWLITGDILSLQDSAKKFQNLSGMSLVARLTKALDTNSLKPQQIAILATLLNEFTNFQSHD